MRRMVVAAAAWIYRAYYSTLRLRYILPDGRTGRPQEYDMRAHVFAVREGDALALAGLMAARRFAVIVAHGRDGDWASGLLGALGCQVIRGSTRRGGAGALRALLRHAESSEAPLGIVADGPLGPAGIAKPGAAICAARSGRPLMALGVAVSGSVTFTRTWSRIRLPLPFATVWIAGQPTPTSDDDAVAAAARLTDHLARARTLARSALAGPRRMGGPVSRFGHAAARGARACSDLALAGLALPFLVPLWFLPRTTAAALGRWYGNAAWLASPRARRVGALNLRRAYGAAMSRQAAARATRAVFGSLGQSIAEGVQVARLLSRGGAADDLYEVEDPALERRILNDDRPRLLVTGHLGSWEIAGLLAARASGRRGAVVVRRLDNPYLDGLWQRVRSRAGAASIEKHGAAREALDRLRRGEDVAMLLDENGGYRGVFVPFYGRPASTRKTPAVLSLATGAPIVVAACVRRPGRPFLYRLALLEPDRTLSPDAAVRDLTARIVATYEGWIRDTPLQWRWVHWRWKTRPDGSEERYERADVRRAFAAEDPTPPRPDRDTHDLGWRTNPR